MQPVINSEKGNYRKAFAAAFPHTLPVLAGYLFIGMAFGVMIQEKGYSVLWAMFMSLVIYAGSGQYLAVNFFVPGFSFVQMIFMEFMVNIRHIFYGLSLIGRFEKMGKKKPYMIFSLTDETYSLYFITKTPKGVREDQFLFAIALLDQSYWILGSGIGALLGSVLPFDAEGIDFAMTALFLVILTEQWLERGPRGVNRKSAAAGLVCAFVCRIVFGEEQFILPSMICIMLLLVAGKRAFGGNETDDGKEVSGDAG